MSDDEKAARDTALRQAIANDPGANADVIVSDAEQFRRFLMGEADNSDEGTV